MSQRIARVSDAGAGVFLTVDDIRSLGIDPAETDKILYSVGDGHIRLSKSEQLTEG